MSSLAAYRLDALVANGAATTRRAFPGPQKRYARAMGVSKSTAQRHLAGDRHSPATHLLLTAATAGDSAFPYLAQMWTTVNQEQVRKASTAELHARKSELDDLEHERQANEDRCTQHALINSTPDQLEAAANADLREAELQLERAAILRELAERKRRND